MGVGVVGHIGPNQHGLLHQVEVASALLEVGSGSTRPLHWERPANLRGRYLLGYSVMPTVYKTALGAQVIPRPLLSSRVEAGFPSPADDYIERALDLNEEFITRPAATFFLRAGGCSMEGAGIYDGDLLIVDRSISPEPNMVIVAVVDGEFTVKRLCKSSDGFVLAAEHPSYPPISIEQDTEVCAWGVVTWVVHRP